MIRIFISIFFFTAINAFADLPEGITPGSTWAVELDPEMILPPPVCKGGGGLCLPSSGLKGIKISVSGSKIVLKGPGAIQGPVLVKSDPPLILIGGMNINKGAIEYTVKKNGGFVMQGIGGGFEVEGLIMPLLANAPLRVDEISLQFTSPEDALLELNASGQKAGVVLRVMRKDEDTMIFIPSPVNFSIFSDNAFFSQFEGKLKSKHSILLKLKDGKEVTLRKYDESDDD